MPEARPSAGGSALTAAGTLRRAKALAKPALFNAGLAGAWHRWRNRGMLTAVMFHRVLPPEDPRAAGANPTYTVSPAELDRCLAFLTRHYAVVGIGDVARAAAGGGPLPPHPLLLTFDDGWQDNAEHALPVLRARGLPALVFVATGHIGRQEGFWQEEVFDRAMAEAGFRDAGIVAADAAMRAFAALAPDERGRRLASRPARPLPRRMATVAELAAMEAAGIAIGGHGHSHEPLTDVADPAEELRLCRSTLSEAGLGGAAPAFSFPHGRCDAALVAAARAAGFGPCFTSAPELVPVTALDRPGGIGRISIDLRPVRRADGSLDMASLAFRLFTAPHGSR